MRPPGNARHLGRRDFVGAAALGLSMPALASTAQAQSRPVAPDRARPRPSEAGGGVSHVLARHVAAARYADLDPATVEKAKLRLLDVVGCAIGGIRGEGSPAFAERVAARGGRPDATLLGTTLRVPASEAAMANAVLARAFDFEVMHVAARDVQVPSHHAPTTVMSALAMAEQSHAGGAAFLTALCVGDDLSARTLAAAGLDFDDGWDGVPLHATMGAAAIAARFLGLDGDSTRHALALAVDQIGGTIQSIWDGGNSWKISQGTAARNGVIAAEMAAAGWTGMADPLLAPRGFYAQFTPGCTRPDLLTEGLGREWFGESYFKPYPSCAANHPTIECALLLRERAALDPTDIASVRLQLAPRVLGLFIAKPMQPGPSLHSQANFNVVFACANALLRGGLRQEDYDPRALAEAALVALMSRVVLAPLPGGTQGVAIEVTLRDGRILREALAGHPRHYADVAGSTPAEIERKFRQQVAFAGGVPAGAADEIVRRIAAIEHERDMADFAHLLAELTRFPSSASPAAGGS